MRLAGWLAIALAAVSGLAACSGGPAAKPPVSATSVQRASATPVAAPGFTVAGAHPVAANGSQDTTAQAGGASCDSTRLAADRRLGAGIAAGFAGTGLPVSASLLRHFLAGQGTAVSYTAGSPVSRLARASAAFQAVSKSVQAAVTRQLRAGVTQVRLSRAQLPLVSFSAAPGELYWGFRGTQGLAVTGRGQRENGRFTGSLSYVIRDSYGFPAGDTLGGFGAPMRYLQTACGAPQHAGGARWFPDAITVTVPFSVAA